MFKKLFALLITGLAIFGVVAALQPEDFTVTRSATYTVPVSILFNQVNNLHNWNAWSPWAKIDPTAKTTFEGPTEGKDALMSWSSENKEVGVGSMKIVKSLPNEKIFLELEFKEPFEGQSIAEFNFEPSNDQTKVTWTMYGKKNFIAKAMGLLMNCDKMLGGQFEVGLENLRDITNQS